MIKLITFLSVLLFVTSPAYAQDVETRVAKVDFSEIESLLESVVLARPENKDLGERFKAKREKSEEGQKQMQAAIMKGEKFNPLEASFGILNESRESKRVAVLCEKFLLELIETTLGEKYDIVLKNDYGSSMLFTKIAIDDVTVLLKQELLRQLPTEKN